MQTIFRLAAVTIFGVTICAGQAQAHDAGRVPDNGFRLSGPVMMTPSERWDAVVTRTARDVAPPVGPCKPTTSGCALAVWERQLVKLRVQSTETQLAAVNKTINALPYRSDAANWGQADYWETPREMFDHGGDCEGFALTKYQALRRLGFADEALSIAVVWDAVDREQHAVLLVRTGTRVRVLDNKRGKMMDWQALSGRYRTLYTLTGGQVVLPGQAMAAATLAPQATPGGARLINGGRTLVITVRPRRTRTTAERVELVAPTGMPAVAATEPVANA
tara:strand:+ start:7974 stop:8804 length:831 start_codon:yes stop_codon:yes gene_type:complete